MKNYIYTLLFLLVTQVALAQTPATIIKEGGYTVTGAENLEATQSITLKPNAHIQSGSTFWARIVSAPIVSTATDSYTPFTFSDENYVFTRGFQKEMQSFNASTAKEGDVIESIAYFDGLGRPMQSVGIKSAPDKEDIIAHIGYDDFGRQDKDWLPYYESSGTLGSYRGDKSLATQQYYHANYADDFSGITGPTLVNAYSQKDLEASPLSRVLQQAAPGKDWKLGNGHEIKFEYATNTATEVHRFNVTTVFTNGVYVPTLVANSTYAANELYKTITKDENWTSGKNHTTEEFTDKQGRVVLKRTYADVSNSGGSVIVAEPHDTYYVYDQYGNLTYVLPPKVNVTDGVSTTELNNLGYQYKYDQRNRLVEKKIPGKGWEYIIYNKLDQPVMTQDENQRTKKEWLFTKYDAFGRVAYTGLHIQPAIIPRNTMQGYADANANQYTKRVGANIQAGTTLYYANEATPGSINKIYTINYYDTYVDSDGLSVPSTIFNQATATGTNTKGLPTVSKVRVLETDDWITTITGYDTKGRGMYSASKNNYLNTTDIVETELDYAGKIIQNKATHKKIGKADIVTVDSFTYDHEARLVAQQQTINDSAEETIAANTYDNLGQLKEKEVGGGLQTVNYSYNVRGWLKSINQDVENDNDLFNFSINYNDPTGLATALFNGNISETHWQTTNEDTAQRGYGYQYDALNRITSGIDNTGNYNLGSTADPIMYDKNGNIMHLKRFGHRDTNITSFGLMDDLTYTYQGNQLKSVNDDIAASAVTGFIDGSETSVEYTYDLNGNMLTDANKGISTNIAYNHLNLPTQVTLGGENIQYIYDATGVKLEKIVSTGATTTYAGNYIYEKPNGGTEDLKFFNHPEGYVDVNGSNYSYVYQYKDHLGNIRLSYKDNNGTLEIQEENNYYPFGLKHKGYNNNLTSSSIALKKTYNGKEFQDELDLNWHDYGARNYDASLGRWMNIDPLADNYYEYSPYAYTINSPIMFIDPDGQKVVWGNEDDNSEEARKNRMIIGSIIHQLRKSSKKFDKAFTRLHNSDAIYKVGAGDIGGRHGLFFANREPNKETDGNGNTTLIDDFGQEVTNGGKGGDITFSLNAISEDGLNLNDVLSEEFAHAYTHDVYTDGGSFDKYDRRPVNGNFEFEGQVISGMVKKESGIRVHPNQPTSTAEKFGRNFNLNKYSKNLESWFNRPDNYYRTGFSGAIINTQQVPTSILQILNKKSND